MSSHWKSCKKWPHRKVRGPPQITKNNHNNNERDHRRGHAAGNKRVSAIEQNVRKTESISLALVLRLSQGRNDIGHLLVIITPWTNDHLNFLKFLGVISLDSWKQSHFNLDMGWPEWVFFVIQLREIFVTSELYILYFGCTILVTYEVLFQWACTFVSKIRHFIHSMNKNFSHSLPGFFDSMQFGSCQGLPFSGQSGGKVGGTHPKKFRGRVKCKACLYELWGQMRKLS